MIQRDMPLDIVNITSARSEDAVGVLQESHKSCVSTDRRRASLRACITGVSEVPSTWSPERGLSGDDVRGGRGGCARNLREMRP
jgi:hypothetical protein